MIDRFHFLNNLGPIEDKYIQEGLTTNYKEVFKPNLFIGHCSYDESDFVKRLREKFSYVKSLWLLNPPWSLNDWHTDIYGRNVAINIPIKMPENSATYVRELFYPDAPTKYFKIKPVQYELYKPTLLNVFEEHCVINPSDETRIVMSITVGDKSLFYKDVIAEVAQW